MRLSNVDMVRQIRNGLARELAGLNEENALAALGYARGLLAEWIEKIDWELENARLLEEEKARRANREEVGDGGNAVH